MTIYDHRVSPPVAYRTTGPCVLIGGVSMPVGNLPAGVYLDGGADPVPSGQIATAWTRVVRDGLSVAVPTCEPAPEPTMAELAAVPLSKLKLRLAMRAQGLEAAMDAAIDATPQTAAEWADADTVRLDYPLLAAALVEFREQAGWTDADVAALVAAARA